MKIAINEAKLHAFISSPEVGVSVEALPYPEDLRITDNLEPLAELAMEAAEIFTLAEMPQFAEDARVHIDTSVVDNADVYALDLIGHLYWEIGGQRYSTACHVYGFAGGDHGAIYSAESLANPESGDTVREIVCAVRSRLNASLSEQRDAWASLQPAAVWALWVEAKQGSSLTFHDSEAELHHHFITTHIPEADRAGWTAESASELISWFLDTSGDVTARWASTTVNLQ